MNSRHVLVRAVLAGTLLVGLLTPPAQATVGHDSRMVAFGSPSDDQFPSGFLVLPRRRDTPDVSQNKRTTWL